MATPSFVGPTALADRLLKTLAHDQPDNDWSEVEDAIRDAVWDAFSQGRISGSLDPDLPPTKKSLRTVTAEVQQKIEGILAGRAGPCSPECNHHPLVECEEHEGPHFFKDGVCVGAVTTIPESGRP